MKNQKIITVVVMSVLVALAGISLSSATYALFSSTSYGKNPDTYSTGLLSIVTEAKSGEISLTNALPKEDSVGMGSEPYIFTLRNLGNIDYKFDIKLLSTSSNSFSSKYIKVQVDDGDVVTLSDCSGSVIKSGIILKAGHSVDISVRVWLSMDTPNTELGKSFESKIVTTGQSVYSSTFNGTSDYVDMGYAKENFGKSLSVGVRFNAGAVNSGVQRIICNQEGAGFAIILSNMKAIFQIHLNGDYRSVTYPTAIEVGKWYTAVATYDGQTVKFYIDGKPVGTPLSYNVDIKVSNVPILIGGNPNPSDGSYKVVEFFKGQISDAFVTKEVLDEDTIANNFTNDFIYEENDDTYFYYKYN